MKRALKIEVPEDEVNRRFAQAYSELNRQVRIPGFRPGKAPQALLEKRYAKMVEEDLVRRLVPDYYDRAIREAGLVPVLVEVPPLERVKIKRNASFSFTATVEIKPKIELRDYRPPNPISLKPDTRTVTDEQIEAGIEHLREQNARFDPIEGRGAQDQDIVLGDLVETPSGGGPEKRHKDVSIEVGTVHQSSVAAEPSACRYSRVCPPPLETGQKLDALEASEPQVFFERRFWRYVAQHRGQSTRARELANEGVDLGKHARFEVFDIWHVWHARGLW